MAMISFKFFVNAIHDAILSANDTLMEKNTGILDKFFEDTSNEEGLQSSLDHALQVSNNIISKKGNVTRDDFKDALDALGNAKKALSGNSDDSTAANSARIPGTLSPKSVVVEYPHQTANGIEFIEVHVPLITLVPLSMSQIQKATVTANFEMEIVNDELQLNFTNKSKGMGRKSKKTWGKLEITITPQESSDGLKQLVEGYEQALKSQIPH
jgi:hypothetical protein